MSADERNMSTEETVMAVDKSNVNTAETTAKDDDKKIQSVADAVRCVMVVVNALLMIKHVINVIRKATLVVFVHQKTNQILIEIVIVIHFVDIRETRLSQGASQRIGTQVEIMQR